MEWFYAFSFDVYVAVCITEVPGIGYEESNPKTQFNQRKEAGITIKQNQMSLSCFSSRNSL